MLGPLTLSLTGMALDIVGAYLLARSILGRLGRLWEKARKESAQSFNSPAQPILRRRSEDWVDGWFGFGTLLLGFSCQFVAVVLDGLEVGSDLEGPGEIWPSVGLAVLAALVAYFLAASRDVLVPLVEEQAVVIDERRGFFAKQQNYARRGIAWPPPEYPGPPPRRPPPWIPPWHASASGDE